MQLTRGNIVVVGILMLLAAAFAGRSDGVPRCYECTSDDRGCEEGGMLHSWATDCGPGTEGCTKITNTDATISRACGNPHRLKKAGCVNKAGVGRVCYCLGDLCNA